MWSVNDNVWKIAPVCGEAVPRPRRHGGMTMAKQMGRKSFLLRRSAQKSAVALSQLATEIANMEEPNVRYC